MKRFDRYIQMVTLRAFLLVALGLTALFSLLEFVDQLAFVGQGHYRLADAAAYTALLGPARFMQLRPSPCCWPACWGWGDWRSIPN